MKTIKKRGKKVSGRSGEGGRQAFLSRTGGQESSQLHNSNSLDGTGVKTRGAGEGRLFVQGEIGQEIGERGFSWKGGLLRVSFSGDSISLST